MRKKKEVECIDCKQKRVIRADSSAKLCKLCSDKNFGINTRARLNALRTEIIGKKFHKLTVLREVDRSTTNTSRFSCICECGNIINTRLNCLVRNKVKSCGCAYRTQNGFARTYVYSSWFSMMERCYDKEKKEYKNYGGRGIIVCDRWHIYLNFLEDMGERSKNLSLDRIDNNGIYEPGNCRWATPKQQSNNNRRNVLIYAFGLTFSLSEWSQFSTINRQTINNRLRSGWHPEDAITQPVKDKHAT